MQSKQCTKCGETKPLSDFHKMKSAPDGHKYDCKPCRKSQAAKFYVDNKTKMRRVSDSWYYKNKAKVAAHRKSRRNDPESRARVLEREAAYAERNRESRKACVRKHYAENKTKYLVKDAKRRAAKLQRTPSWASDQLIAAYYKEAKRLEELTGIQFHVDHIIPLQGELVSGLHVESNLQLLPAHENLGKSNQFDPATFCAHA